MTHCAVIQSLNLCDLCLDYLSIYGTIFVQAIHLVTLIRSFVFETNVLLSLVFFKRGSFSNTAKLLTKVSIHGDHQC